MTVFVNTSGQSGPEWVLSAMGVSQKIREIGEELGVEVLDVTTGHQNLPTTFTVSTNQGVGTLHIGSTDAESIEKEIRAHFKGDATDKLDVPVIEETKPENLPKESKKAEDSDVEFIPAPTFIEKLDEPTEKKTKK